jgi:WD40 repeat protein
MYNAVMRRIPWRSVVSALAVGSFVYWGLMSIPVGGGPTVAFAISLQEKTWACNSLEFSPDGSLLAIGVGNVDPAKVCLGLWAVSPWVVRAVDGEVLATPQKNSQDNAFCAFSPKGDLFALYNEGIVDVRQADTGSLVKSYRPFEDAVFFDGEGRLWNVSADNQGIEVWSCSALDADDYYYKGPEFLLIGGRFWALNPLKTALRLHDFKAGFHQSGQIKSWELWDHPPRDAKAFRRFYAGVKNGQTELWDMSTGKSLGEIPTIENNWGTTVAPDGQCIVDVDLRDVVLYDLTAKCMRRITLTPNFQASAWPYSVYRPALSTHRKHLALPVVGWQAEPLLFTWLANLGIQTGGSGQPRLGVKIYDITTCAELAYFPDATCAAFSHDGKRLALAYETGEIAFLDMPLRSQIVIDLALAIAATVLTFVASLWWVRRRIRK